MQFSLAVSHVEVDKSKQLEFAPCAFEIQVSYATTLGDLDSDHEIKLDAAMHETITAIATKAFFQCLLFIFHLTRAGSVELIMAYPHIAAGLVH